MADRIVTVFGGTGFLGSCVVRHLVNQSLSVRVASRHPNRVPRSSAGATIKLDIRQYQRRTLIGGGYRRCLWRRQMPLASMPNVEQRHFMPCMWKRLNGWHGKRNGQALSA